VAAGDARAAEGLRAVRATREDFRLLRRRLALPVGLFFGVALVGTLGYLVIGGGKVSLLDAIYMTANVVTTAGFRESVDMTQGSAGRIFTIALLFVGAGVGAYAISTFTAFIVEGDLTEEFRRRRMSRTVDAMQDHFIVCGVGQAGLAVVQELVATKRTIVIIEADDANAERIEGLYPDVPLVRGDFTDDDVLLRAGVTRASGIVLCVDSDKDSLVGTVTARQLNARIRIIARATDDRAIQRLRSAGADGVVSPGLIGGMRLASELVRPSVVSFLDKMLRAREGAMRIEEVEVPADSPLAGHTVRELDTRQYQNLLVLGVQTPEGEVLYHPPQDYRVEAGCRLIVMAEAAGVQTFQRAFTPMRGSGSVRG
jgi:voltage-gated potassium channel